MTGPAHRIAHALHLNLRLELQSLPFRSLRQHQLGLPNPSRHRISSIQASALEYFAVLILDTHAQHARNPGNAVIGEADDKSEVARILVAPDKRRPDQITNPPIDPVKRRRISLVVAHQ